MTNYLGGFWWYCGVFGGVGGAEVWVDGGSGRVQ